MFDNTNLSSLLQALKAPPTNDTPPYGLEIQRRLSIPQSRSMARTPKKYNDQQEVDAALNAYRSHFQNRGMDDHPFLRAIEAQYSPPPPMPNPATFRERFGAWQGGEKGDPPDISMPRGFDHKLEDFPGVSDPNIDPEELYSTSTFMLNPNAKPSFRRMLRPKPTSYFNKQVPSSVIDNSRPPGWTDKDEEQLFGPKK